MGITRPVSERAFEIEGMVATSPVVLGHDDEGPLLGAVTLETLGLVQSPLTRRPVPMRLLPSSTSAARPGVLLDHGGAN